MYMYRKLQVVYALLMSASQREASPPMTCIEPDAHAVASIMLRPYAVVDEEISRQGSLPMVAPVKPYTLQHVQ